MSHAPDMSAGTRPEIELLLRSARVDMDCATAARARALLRRDLDWPCVLSAADAHGTAPLYWHLNRLAPGAVPEAARNHLCRWFHDNARHNLLLTGELLRLLSLFAAHGIRAIPFKGPTLAACAYGNLALRQFNDLDLLLRPADVPRAAALLAADGYRVGLPLPPAQESAYLASLGQVPLVSAGRGCLVELHAHIAPRDFFFPLDLERLWPRLRTMALGGQEVRTLAGEDLLVVLCAHGAKHFWGCLGWVCDVAELLRVRPEMNWPGVLEVARSVRCERILGLGLLLAHDLLQAPVPEEFVRRARASRAVRALAARVCRRMFRHDGLRPGGLDNAVFQLRARERLRDGVRYALSLALTPTVADWTCLSVPASLPFLYHLTRPARLAAKFGRFVLRISDYSRR